MEPQPAECGCNCSSICSEPLQYVGQGKSYWPELVGENAEVAAVIIQTENSNVRAIIVRPGEGMLQNWVSDRVYVLANSQDFVVCPPFIA
ncbi:unnamed protein product [Amaranthus hypochondriacus]